MSATCLQEFVVEHDDSRIFGKIGFPEGEGPWPVVIFSHGFSACRVYDSGMEQRFLEQGMAFAAFDFCTGVPGSQSSGTMKEMSVLTEANDLNDVIDWVCGLPSVDTSSLFLLGSSQGGYVSTYVASERPDDVAALALFFPAFNIGDDARARIAAGGGEIPDEIPIGDYVVGRRYAEDALSVDIFECMGAYPGDVLIVHGAQDEIVPVAFSQRAVQAFGGACRLEVIEGLGHGFRAYPLALHDRALDLALEFFAAHVDGR